MSQPNDSRVTGVEPMEWIALAAGCACLGGLISMVVGSSGAPGFIVGLAGLAVVGESLAGREAAGRGRSAAVIRVSSDERPNR